MVDENPAPTVAWNETAAMAGGRMRLTAAGSVVVVGERGDPLGRITRDEIERCRRRGNWLDAILVRDLVRLPAT